MDEYFAGIPEKSSHLSGSSSHQKPAIPALQSLFTQIKRYFSPPGRILAGVGNTTAKNRNAVTGPQNLDILIPLHYDRKE